jgi:hypothetical protein
VSTTAFRDDEVGASLRAEELEAELAPLASALEARAGKRPPPQGLHALSPMAILTALLLALESPPSHFWADDGYHEIADPLWTRLGSLPFTFAVALGITAVLSALPVAALLAPSEILPRFRAAQIRRRYAPPPRDMRASARVEELERKLVAAQAILARSDA